MFDIHNVLSTQQLWLFGIWFFNCICDGVGFSLCLVETSPLRCLPPAAPVPAGTVHPRLYQPRRTAAESEAHPAAGVPPAALQPAVALLVPRQDRLASLQLRSLYLLPSLVNLHRTFCQLTLRLESTKLPLNAWQVIWPLMNSTKIKTAYQGLKVQKKINPLNIFSV